MSDAALQRLWSSLRTRIHGKKARPELRPQFTKEQLRAWVERQAIPGSRGNAQAWACTYKAPGCSKGRHYLAAAELSLDHVRPVSKQSGGLTTLDNLAICCKRCNTLKGSLGAERFRQLLDLIATWPRHEQTSLLNRLMNPPRAWARAKKAATSAEEDW